MGYGQYSTDSRGRSNPLYSTAAKTAEGKRTKQVYKTDEIPHLWAHKTQSSARNSQGNLYFDGDTIYSYGSHFPIARHVTALVTGRAAVLLTTQTHSVTTGSHVSAVRRSIPADLTVFPVNDVTASPAAAIAYLTVRAGESATTLTKGSTSPLMHRNKRVELYRSIAADISQAVSMQKFFGHVGRATLPSVPAGIEELCATVDAAKAANRIKSDARVAVKHAADRERWAECERLSALELPEKISAWRNGGYVSLPYGLPTMLRITGDEVETSRGARFPLPHALRALTLYTTIKSRGESWARNGHSIHLGHYQIDSIDTDGTIRAGCHVVEAGEVEHFITLVSERYGFGPGVTSTFGQEVSADV